MQSGFCSISADSKVDPERGRPEMKWNVFDIYVTGPEVAASTPIIESNLAIRPA